MSGRLSSKRALVTAAGAGIGRATALAMSREGAEVLAVDIDQSALQSVAAEDETVRTSVLDVTSSSAVESLIKIERIFDILFNCAGVVHQGALLECDETSWRRSFALNVDSMYFLCKGVLPGMIARRCGSIINMSSVASSIKGVPKRFAYGATKAAVIGLTKSIAADYVGSGVRCNAICPGTVNTPSLARRVSAVGGDESDVWRSFAERQPMGRLGDAREIAALAVYLASDESSFTTGAIHVIDGGWTT
jgi:2-keto-3-deoxy-L-fuconate dehydrogenase